MRWFRADLARDREAKLQGFLDGVSVVFHCAGEVRDVSAMRDVHVGGMERLVAAATGRVTRVVQLSSCGVYGRVRDGVVGEDHPLRPVGPYETTKLAAERFVMDAAQVGAFEAVVLRPSVIIGEDMPNDSLRSWIRSVARGQFAFLGPPGARVNYVHVQDVVRALERVAWAASDAPRAYNLSLGGTVEQVVGVMCRELGRPGVGRRIPARVAYVLASIGAVVPGFPLTPSRVEALTNRATYDASLISEELGFSFAVSLDDAVARVVRSLHREGATVP